MEPTKYAEQAEYMHQKTTGHSTRNISSTWASYQLLGGTDWMEYSHCMDHTGYMRHTSITHSHACTWTHLKLYTAHQPHVHIQIHTHRTYTSYVYAFIHNACIYAMYMYTSYAYDTITHYTNSTQAASDRRTGRNTSIELAIPGCASQRSVHLGMCPIVMLIHRRIIALYDRIWPNMTAYVWAVSLWNETYGLSPTSCPNQQIFLTTFHRQQISFFCVY